MSSELSVSGVAAGEEVLGDATRADIFIICDVAMQRPSILLRPQHRHSRANEESVDAQFEKEQALLELKRQKYAAAVKSMEIACGECDSHEKSCAAEKHRQFQSAQLAEKHSRAELQRQAEMAALCTRRAMDDEQAAQEAEKLRRRREELRATAAQNKNIAEKKKEAAEEQRRATIALENANLAIRLREKRHF